MFKISYKKTISVWSILILLTLLVLVGNYYGSAKTNAKYVQSVSGTDGARVACFVSDIRNLTAADQVVLSPATSGYVPCYTFLVTNEADGKISEVTMNYELLIEITGPAGLHYRVTPNGHSLNACDQSDTMSGDVLSTSGGVFLAGVMESHEYVIEASWDGASDVSYENANIPITVKVSANVVQKD